MEVRVSNLAGAEELAQNWADLVISLVDINVELPTFQDIQHHVIRCSDSEGFSDAWAPKYVDIIQALDLCHNDMRILVHCEGGISRSPAFAIGLLVKSGLDIPTACDYVHAQRPNMAPNFLILLHCEAYLQLNGLMVPQVRKVVSNYDQGLVLWCSECKTHFKDGDNCPGKHWLPPPDEDVYL